MIKKLLFPVILSIVTFTQIHAQTLPPTYVINSEPVVRQFLNNHYWQVLNDKNSSYTIETVQKEPLTNQFTYIRKNSEPPFSKTTWFRFCLKNNSGDTLNLSIAANVAKADFYIPDNNGIMHRFTTGNEINWHHKDGFKKDNAIPFEINPGQQIMIYLKTVNHRAFLSDTLKFALFNTKKLEKSILSNYQNQYTANSELFSMVLCGLFLIAGIFILMIYFTIREKIYLYFSLFLFSGSLSYLHPVYSVEHFSFSLSLIIHLISYLWAFFVFQFVRHYLQVSKYYPRWNKWIGIVMYLFLGILIIARILFTSVYHYDFATSTNIGVIARITDIIFWLSFLITIIIFSLKHAREIRMFLIGVLPFSLAILCLNLIEIGSYFFVFARNIVRSGSLFWGYANGIGSFWLTVVISLVLFKRFGLQEKRIEQEKLEKEKLAREQEIQKKELIAQQKTELEKQVIARTSELKHSLEELKATQSQLIHSEKMASLGELTAGIAHEIQNPLNFVNNFSEVSTELLEEIKENIKNGNLNEVKDLLEDVIQNLEKIHTHGGRADGIIKSMLQHSRGSSGEKVPTDINALADEYLRLSYHGLRAKDKSFNADFKLEVDKTLPKIEVVPQDIGRVLLNLINNAFYAVSARAKSGEKNFKPEVVVTTEKHDGTVEIRVKDNGDGIPEDIREKIFQPFFTTKPTGIGTGLGLSLSYEIITKGHEGQLKVQSMVAGPGDQTGKETGTEFIITIPIKS